MDAKTQISVVEQGYLNLMTEPTVEEILNIIRQLWNIVEHQQSELKELRNEFRCTVSRTLEENQELKWASHYSQSSGDNLSLEDFLVELDD
jgi:uncharacterized coiled-coil protein SlyX